MGAGFSGCVLAHELSKNLSCTIDIWDERDHIGGNCHTSRDSQTGIMVHRYGPHIFHTNDKNIWDYVNSFVELRPYVHRVKAFSKGKVYPLPVNLQTINQLFDKSFNPEEARSFLESLADTSIDEPANFEEQALRFIGVQLYKSFFYGYTKKQWGCEPSELPASILKRIPVRFNYDDNYHNSLYTGIPATGYTAIMEKMLDHPHIKIFLQKKFTAASAISEYDHVFYCGPIDAYFGHRHGRLGYRTVTFEQHIAKGDHQGTTQMNYCDEEIPYTRIAEHKHFTPWEQFDTTIYFKEFSKETEADDIPYYPKRLQRDKELLLTYRQEAMNAKNVSFIGRLATYRYLDMHQVIGEALSFSKKVLESFASGTPVPVFENQE